MWWLGLAAGGVGVAAGVGLAAEGLVEAGVSDDGVAVVSACAPEEGEEGGEEEACAGEGPAGEGEVWGAGFGPVGCPGEEGDAAGGEGDCAEDAVGDSAVGEAEEGFGCGEDEGDAGEDPGDGVEGWVGFEEDVDELGGVGAGVHAVALCGWEDLGMGFGFRRRFRVGRRGAVNVSRSGVSGSLRLGRVTVNSRGRVTVRLWRGVTWRL